MDGKADFLFSVVMPVYNVADYLEEAVESVLGQSIGFEEHVQLILVNDGSTDGSAAICARYAQRYPENVLFLDKENGGVSTARNAGLDRVRGEYVSFLDSDDKWGLDVFELARDFFEAHPEADILSFPSYYFEAREGPHTLNRKHARTRVIDLDEEPNTVQLACRDCFLRAEAIGGLRFDPSLHFAQDVLFINSFLLEHRKLGVSAQGRYWYRKRDRGDSNLNRSSTDPEFYLHTPKAVHLALFERSEELYGRVLQSVQYAVMHDLQFRLKRGDKGILDAEGLRVYRSYLVELLGKIDDQVIAHQGQLPVRYKVYAYALKHGVEPQEICAGMYLSPHALRSRFVADGEELRVSLMGIGRLDKKLHIRSLTRTEGGVQLEGVVGTLAYDCPLDLRFRLGGTSYEAERLPAPGSGAPTPCDGDILPRLGFRVRIPCEGGARRKLKAFLVISGRELPAEFIFGSNAGLTHLAQNSYCLLGDLIARHGMAGEGPERESFITLEAASPVREAVYEHRLRRELAADPATAHLVRWRRIAKREQRRRRRGRGPAVWLIADHLTGAGDNGEALFLHLHEHPIEGVRPVFAVSASSPDFERLQRFGRVVDAGGDEEKRLMFRAEVFASSYVYGADVNPFEEDRPYLSDCLGAHFVFLQHGVIKEDLSRVLNKDARNTELFLTSAPREWESVAHGDYGYAEDEVLLSGLPRHDRLLADARTRRPSRRLYIMPTWRKNLSCEMDPKTGLRPPFPGFADSDFFAFFQALIASPRLDAMLAERGWDARFVLHPNFRQEAVLFHGGDRVQVVTECDYREAFLDASCLLTDYSSVFFDFALLKRPIVYAQFDRERYFRQHVGREGYFSFEDDGFGPVCRDLDATLDALEAALDAQGRMPEEYARRVDDFFYWPDRPRAQIVCEAIEQRFSEGR